MQDNSDIFFQSEDAEIEEAMAVHEEQIASGSGDPVPPAAKPATETPKAEPPREESLEALGGTPAAEPEFKADQGVALNKEPPKEPDPVENRERILSNAEAEAAVESMTAGVEALVFGSGAPIARSEIRKVFVSSWKDFSEERQTEFGKLLSRAFDRFSKAWGEQAPARGFELLDIGGGWVFRTASIHSDLLRALRTEKPTKLSRAALEVLSVVAYRQPTTKAEVDYVRGVDCGGTLRGLLDRGLVKIVGKKEEPGRPLLYGTTHRFLSLFNLGNLRQLPTLREYHELSEDSVEKVREFDGFPSIEELKENMGTLTESDETAVDDLEVAVVALGESEDATRTALAAEGISLIDESR